MQWLQVPGFHGGHRGLPLGCWDMRIVDCDVGCDVPSHLTLCIVRHGDIERYLPRSWLDPGPGPYPCRGNADPFPFFGKAGSGGGTTIRQRPEMVWALGLPWTTGRRQY